MQQVFYRFRCGLPFLNVLCFFVFLSAGCSSQKKMSKAERDHFYVSGRFLYSPQGEKVVLRGVNNMNVVTDRTGAKVFPEITKTGANVVRIMWMLMGGGGDKLDIVIGNCIAHKMIPIIELHDATGKWNKLDTVVDYWVRPDVVTILKKYQKYLLLNIANEAGNAEVTMEEFRLKYTSIVQKLRAAGIHIPIMIDAANWGRNEEYLLTNGPALLKEDPDHNLIFSWHVWDSGIKETRIQSAIDRSIQLNIPFIIGEFAPMEVKCKCCIPYKYILEYCQQKEIGWMAWSWGPGNSDCAAMDMTKTMAFETLYDWGLEVAVTDSNSIKNTSKRPAMFR
jgi:mannan endo-1,4-beta-mannosidase